MVRVYSRNDAAARDDSDEGEVLVRERTNMVRETPHLDRDAQAHRGDAHPEVKANAWINPTSLDAPEPRKGFVQRWISDGSINSADTSHWMKKMREGWRPREASSIPAEQRALYQSAKSDSGADIIRVAGLVLCEIPVTVARARREALSGALDNQLSSIPESVQELTKKGGEHFGPVKVQSKEFSARGRQSATMVD